MSSHAGNREEGRRLSIRTLIFASLGSATAAILTSYFWTAGTPIAAAATPVIVAIVSELLTRPTERIARALTTETNALPADAAGAGSPPRDETRAPGPAREAPGHDERARRTASAGRQSDVRVYKTGAGGSLPWKPILATAGIAFAIGIAVLTLPELIAGESFGKGDGNTTLFGGRGGKDDGKGAADPEQQPSEPEPTSSEPQQTVTQPEQTVTVPPSETETEPAPTTPQQTAPQPAPKKPPTP